jgi:hypothetical protein
MIGTSAAICAGIPQLRKLILAKQADEFSISTWLIWLFSQTAALAYALSMNDILYAIVSAFWLTFYAAMVILIFKYRTPSDDLLAEEA